MPRRPLKSRATSVLFHSNLRRYMDALYLSDANLGILLGVSRVTVWRWRKGRREPRGDARDALAKALGVPLDHLYRDWED